jgi:hypothetical protein
MLRWSGKGSSMANAREEDPNEDYFQADPAREQEPSGAVVEESGTVQRSRGEPLGEASDTGDAGSEAIPELESPAS